MTTPRLYSQLLLLCFVLATSLCNAAIPSVSSISPINGPNTGGTTVTITGSNFTNAQSVQFGPQAAASFTIVSDTQITAVTPSDAPNVVSVVVSTTDGPSAANHPNDYYVFQGDWIGYVTNDTYGKMHLINLTTNTKHDLSIGFAASFIAITPDGRVAYIGNQNGNYITSINLQVYPPVFRNIITTSIAPVGIAVTPDGTTVYTVHLEKSLIIPITVATDTPQASFSIYRLPANVAIAPNGLTAYVAVPYTSSLMPFDLTTTPPTPGTPIPVGSWPLGICISPDGSTAYVSNKYSNNVTQIDLNTQTVLNTFTVAEYPMGIAITPDGSTVYVACNGAAGIISISTAYNVVSGFIDVNNEPVGIAISPDGKTAYVANSYSSNFSIVDLTQSPPVQTATIELYATPFTVAISPDQAPLALFTGTISAAGTASSFDASASISPVGTISNYSWDFGDGHTASSSSPTTTNTYAASGTYNVKLTVTNSGGTSTSQVFTGYTVSNNGGSTAVYTQSFSVP